MGQSAQSSIKTIALNLLAAEKAVRTPDSAGTAPETHADRIRQIPEPESPTSTQQLACGSADSAERPDVIGEATRIFKTAWRILRNLEAEGDHRGAVAALRACQESFEMLTGLLKQTTDNRLAGVSDECILREVKHRDLKIPIVFKVTYNDDDPRDPDVSHGA
jgi:hypothetical protein